MGARSSKEPLQEGVKRPPRGKLCGVEHCGELAHGGKSYCGDHMDLIPKADAIMAEVDARRREIDAVLSAGPDGWKRVNVDGSIAREIVETLKLFGAQPMPKLTKIVSLKRDIVVPYVKALVECGRLKVGYMHVGGRSTTEVVSSSSS